MRPQVRPLVSSRGESTEPFRVRFASGTISLCWNRRANRVRSNLHERLLQPVLFRFPVRNLDPAFSLPVARHIPIPDDSRGRTLSEGHVHETTFRDCLQRVEGPAMRFVIADKQMRRFVLDRDDVSVPSSDDEIGTTAEPPFGVYQRGSSTRESCVEMNPIRREQHREPFLGSVLVDQKIVETDIEGAFVDREMTQGRREERGVTKGDHIQWSTGEDRLAGSDRLMMRPNEFHLVRAPEIRDEVMRREMFHRQLGRHGTHRAPLGGQGGKKLRFQTPTRLNGRLRPSGPGRDPKRRGRNR